MYKENEPHSEIAPPTGGVFLFLGQRTPQWLLTKIEERFLIQEASEVSGLVLSGLGGYALERYGGIVNWYAHDHRYGGNTKYSQRVVAHTNGLMELSAMSADLKSAVYKYSCKYARLLIPHTINRAMTIGQHQYETVDIYQTTYLARRSAVEDKEILKVFDLNIECSDTGIAYANFEDQVALILDIEAEREK